LERALRWGAAAHDGQVRKGAKTPYFEHVAGVALILERFGFEESVVIAGLLHDVVEDTEVTLDQVRERFGSDVATIVAACSEVKTDDEGRKRPWIDRKRDHLQALEGASVAVAAVILADKLHNLLSMACDLEEGRPVWSIFNAPRSDVLWYYHTALDRVGAGDPRLEALASQCRQILRGLENGATVTTTDEGGSGQNREKSGSKS
jgi:(p)ppGpp synthase/HD superfamily hydrolase